MIAKISDRVREIAEEGGCEHTKRTREETEDANYSVVITGVRRTPSRTKPPHESHTALPVKHGGTSVLVTVECVYFCEIEGVAFAIIVNQGQESQPRWWIRGLIVLSGTV